MILLALLGCSGPPAPAGRLVLVDEAGGRPAVVVVSADGSGARRLEVCPAAAFPGPVDPRGQLVAVLCTEGEDEASHVERLRLAPLEGAAAYDAGPPASRVRSPVWVDGGDAVVFESSVASFRDLYRVGRSGGVVERVTDHPAGQFEPSWGGGRLAFVTSRFGDPEVVVRERGEDRRVTTATGEDTRPQVRPDGSAVAWLSDRGGQPAVWVEEGGVTKALGGLRGVPDDLAWSPDGALLLVTVRLSGGGVGVDAMTLAGARRWELGSAEERASFPAVSPDGRFVAWTRGRGPDDDVVVRALAGGEVRCVVCGAGAQWLPRWVP